MRLGYAVAGRGYPVVRSAHWMTNIESDWRTLILEPWLTRLASRYQLYRYDQRGSGMSEGEGLPLSVDAYTRDLEAVIDAAKLERFALIGASGGGPAAIEYAARYPDRVSHLVLVGAFAQGALRRNIPPEARELFLAGVKMIEHGWGSGDESFLQLFTSQFWPDATLEYMHSFNVLQRESQSPKQAAAVVIANGNADVSAFLEQVRCPTLVLHCRGDLRIPVEQGRLIASRIPNARFVPLESRNHVPMPFEGEFQRMFEEIHAFLPQAEHIDPTHHPFPGLSPRERGVLELLARGHDNLQIAAHLAISEKTVRNNITGIFDKLAVENRGQAIVKAREAGLGRA
ncbi:MAG: alpha/beta fold hydrolase [Burkholderiales bacterium]